MYHMVMCFRMRLLHFQETALSHVVAINRSNKHFIAHYISVVHFKSNLPRVVYNYYSQYIGGRIT